MKILKWIALPFLVLFSRKKKKVDVTDSATPKNSEKKGQDTSTHPAEQPRKLWLENFQFILAAIIILAVGILLFFLIRGFFIKDTPGTDNKSAIGNISAADSTLMDYGLVTPDSAWITAEINYDFRFWTEKGEHHSFYVEYSSKNGGWTKKVLTLAYSGYKESLPADAVSGKARVTAGPGEYSKFKINLYKFNPR